VEECIKALVGDFFLEHAASVLQEVLEWDPGGEFFD
jgi:hypothetical protein